MRAKKKLLFVGLLTELLLFSGCAGRMKQYTSAEIAMGTVTRQNIYTSGEDVTGTVTRIITDLEREELSWRIPESEIAVINAASQRGNGINTEISEKLNDDLAVAFDVSKKSGGAFDITMGPVVRLWNIDAGEAVLPSPEEIREALARTGYEKVALADGSIRLPEGMSLDLGAVGKGIACDRVAAYLRTAGVQGATIMVGGSVLTYGEKPDGSDWKVGIVDPFDTSRMLGVLSLKGEWYVSTSGDYERYVEVDGIRYHHILDPVTGYPADSGLKSVTILCGSGILSDALSTACFVLGEERGMQLAREYGAEALFVDESGGISMTDGMRAVFTAGGR